MNLSAFLATLITLVFFQSLPVSALTGARIWTHFYLECPDDAAPPSPSATQKAPLTTSSFPSSSARAASSFTAAATPSTSTILHSTKSNLTTVTMDIRAGDCAPVPIASDERDSARSLSIDAQITIPSEPFHTCNITVHEVPDCMDDPLIAAPIDDDDGNRVTRSECKPRNFDAYSDVWVRLDCGEQGTGTDSDSSEKRAEAARLWNEVQKGRFRHRFYRRVSQFRPIRRAL